MSDLSEMNAELRSAVEARQGVVTAPGQSDAEAERCTPRESVNPKDVASRQKLPLQLLPPEFKRQTALVLQHGARKYGESNWLDTPVQFSNYIAAIDRHSLALQEGEDIDPESGLPHAAHIAATAAIILDAAKHGTLIDDRRK